MSAIYSLITKIIVILWMAAFYYMFYAFMHIPGDHPKVTYPSFQACSNSPAFTLSITCYNELNQSHKQIDKLVAKSDDEKSLPKVLYEDIFRIPPPTYSCKNNAQGQLTCQVAKIDLSQL